MTVQANAGTHPLRREVVVLLQVAMAVFTWTVVIGILNGTDIVDFSRKTVLSHVHMGTLGWITMCVFAASLWLFGADANEREVRAARWLTVLAAVALPAFAFTFALTFGEWRAVMGAIALAAIVGFFAWVAVRFRHVEMSATHLGFLAALGTAVTGGTIGVLLATRIATGREVITVRADDAHPATMVVGFLIPVGMALAEWGLGWPTLRKAGRLGWAQIGLPFLGGILLMVSLLADIEPLAPIAALIELVGVVIFIIRNLGSARAVDWRTWSPGQFAVLASVATIVNILFINYLAGKHEGDFDLVPTGQLLALDHMMFVGVLTNAIFALLAASTRESRQLPWADRVVLAAVNVGLAGFFVSLLADWTWLERTATPLMGAGVLLGLATYTYRFRTGDAPEARPVAVLDAVAPGEVAALPGAGPAVG